jgi:hypothetical protein
MAQRRVYGQWTDQVVFTTISYEGTRYQLQTAILTRRTLQIVLVCGQRKQKSYCPKAKTPLNLQCEKRLSAVAWASAVEQRLTRVHQPPNAGGSP